MGFVCQASQVSGIPADLGVVFQHFFEDWFVFLLWTVGTTRGIPGNKKLRDPHGYLGRRARILQLTASGC